MLSPDRQLTEVDFVAFDLETTGLYPVANHIVEFGAVRFRLDGGESAHFSQLVNPGGEIPPRATEIHGITDAMIQAEPSVSEVLPEFFDFIAVPDALLLAHNASFDVGFLTFAAAKLGVDLPPNPVLDTLQLARMCIRGARSYRLEHVAVHLRVAETEDHRALSDSRLLMSVFCKVVNRARKLRVVRDLLHICPPVDLERSQTFPIAPPPGFEQLNDAIEHGRPVVIVYDGGSKGSVQRTITPRAVLESNGRAYLIAYCHIDQMEKTYRFDRIREME